MIACVDVDYRDAGAIAACVCFQSWSDDTPASESVIQISDVEPYQSGQFYRRELPGILAVLKLLDSKTVRPTFTTEDIARIAAHLGMDAAAFTTEYLAESEDRGLLEPKSLPCPFLAADNRCKIYEVRPTSCAEYPHTDKPGFATRTHLHSGNTIQCPAVFYIVEAMRAGGVRHGGW